MAGRWRCFHFNNHESISCISKKGSQLISSVTSDIAEDKTKESLSLNTDLKESIKRIQKILSYSKNQDSGPTVWVTPKP